MVLVRVGAVAAVGAGLAAGVPLLGQVVGGAPVVPDPPTSVLSTDQQPPMGRSSCGPPRSPTSASHAARSVPYPSSPMRSTARSSATTTSLHRLMWHRGGERHEAEKPEADVVCGSNFSAR